jgi:hypothetical protein
MSKDLDSFFYVESVYRKKLENLLPKEKIEASEIEFSTPEPKYKVRWSSPFNKISTHQLIALAQKIRIEETSSILNWHHSLLDLLEDETKTKSIIILDKLRE